jgi:hypothetical protein
MEKDRTKTGISSQGIRRIQLRIEFELGATF